ncbi:ERV/ALR sulfhydryl oxidase domain-containing protein [Pseudoneurospora amorphoporcata]|uniref:Sulfhydryl oxidase n=1 Tax=Pseudoneurospora amorphoporcata TaxID=241081 RepID=A0AAN6NSN1_9PEZI|nr:ERV/ALR sulfhydryl oxidase domain-containing protein [Pseudoneurospora amorphoporcata]
MARRPHITLMLVVGVVLFVFTTYMLSSSGSSVTTQHSETLDLGSGDHTSASSQDDGSKPASFGLVSEDILKGGSIAPKLENATAKAELGRASWRLFHTMMARFPETPTADESLALKTYIQLFARLYPCGDCASHFQKLLKKYPPQTSGRNAAAGWACFVHNEVNKRLKKEQFDCNNIGDFYDCGCGEEGGAKKEGSEAGAVAGAGGEAKTETKEGGGDLKMD